MSWPAAARAWRLGVAAQGVETGAQWQLLRRAGCDFVQGYFFSRRLEDAEFRHWLADPRRLPRGAAGAAATTLKAA